MYAILPELSTSQGLHSQWKLSLPLPELDSWQQISHQRWNHMTNSPFLAEIWTGLDLHILLVTTIVSSNVYRALLCPDNAVSLQSYIISRSHSSPLLNDPSVFGGECVASTFYLGLSILQSSILFLLASCESLCYSTSTTNSSFSDEIERCIILWA